MCDDGLSTSMRLKARTGNVGGVEEDVGELSREDQDDMGAKFVVADDGLLVFCLEPALFKTNNVLSK